MSDNPNVYQGALGDERPNDVQISADGTTIYAAGADGNLYVYSATTGDLLHSWDVGTKLGGMDISPDGAFAMVVDLTPVEEHYADFWPDNQFTITVYKVDLATGSISSYPLIVTGYNYSFFDVAILDNGKVLLSESILPGWSGGGASKVLDLSTGEYADGPLGGQDAVLSPSEDGSTVLSLAQNISDAPLALLDVGTGAVVYHNSYQDNVEGFNSGLQAFSPAAHLVVQSLWPELNVYDEQLHYQLNLTDLHPEFGAGAVGGIAFDSTGQFLFVLNVQDDSIYKLSTADWSVVGQFDVGADITNTDGDFGNRLLVSPDGSYFTVVTDDGLVMVDPTAPPPATEGDDTLTGTPDSDVIDGLGGSDLIKGYAGDDHLSGAAGNDTIVGGAGADSIDGGEDNDVIYSGDASLSFGFGNPPLLDTGTDIDTLIGGNGSDHLFAGYGDSVDGGADGLYGDSLYISFQGAPEGVTADFTQTTQVIGGGTITGIENIGWVEGSNFADDITIAADSVGTEVYGMGGDDVITGGAEVIDGGDGNDVLDARFTSNLSSLFGGAGNDIIYGSLTAGSDAEGGDGDDTIYASGIALGGSGNDTIVLLQSLGGSVTGHASPVDGEAGDDIITGADGADAISGGSGADTIDGGGGDDRIYSNVTAGNGWDNDITATDGGDEHDVITAGAGDDGISAGYGDDVDGGDGNDVLRLNLSGASSGLTLDTSVFVAGTPIQIGGGTIQNVENVDYLVATNFVDHLTVATQGTPFTLDAAGGDDWITVNGGTVYAIGGDGNDRIDIYGGNVLVRGGEGIDAIFVERGAVTAYGDGGDDSFMSGAGADTFDGGDGTDWVSYLLSTKGVTVDIAAGTSSDGDQLSSMENVDGSNFADKLSGDWQSNYLAGRAGNDVLDAGGGNDILDGGTGNDTLKGGAGDDIYFIDSASDIITELSGQGSDLVFASINYTLGTNIENATADGTAAINLTGNALNNELMGNSAANVLNGGGGNDFLDGQGGADTLIGGAGNDFYVVDNVGDKITEASGAGTDEVDSFVSYTLASNVYVETLVALGTAAIDLTGNALANTIVGNSAANVLDGGTGADRLTGSGGVDTFVYRTGGGRDVITDFSAGEAINIYGYTAAQSVVQSGLNVVVTLASGNTITVNNSTVANVSAALHFQTSGGGGGGGTPGTITGTSGADTLNGTSGNDTINGLGGNDTLNGSGGNDILDGGTGNDTMRGGTGNDIFYVDSTSDVVTELSGQGSDEVRSTVSYTLGSNLEKASALGSGAINLTGNTLANTLTGNSGANIIKGNGGADTIKGGLGNDTLSGGSGADVFVYSDVNSGADKITDFVSGSDKINLHAFGITSANVHTAVSGSNLVISVDADHNGTNDFTITLVGVTHIAAADYVF